MQEHHGSEIVRAGDQEGGVRGQQQGSGDGGVPAADAIEDAKRQPDGHGADQQQGQAQGEEVGLEEMQDRPVQPGLEGAQVGKNHYRQGLPQNGRPECRSHARVEGT